MRRHLRSLILLLAASSNLAPASPPPAAKHVVYTNRQYGLRVTLPSTWKGYNVQAGDPWSGFPVVNGELQEDPARQERGPMLYIHHPAWKGPRTHEDLPIMIFTLAQWAMVQNDLLVTSAAPIPPSELARNATYVFALPPRYNFDYSPGWEEVEAIVAGHPVRAF